MNRGPIRWLREMRDSARVAYVLTLSTRLLTSVMSLMWIRLLLGAMQTDLYSVFLAFQKVITLGGLGDLGMGGAVSLKAGQYLGQKKESELKTFLATARTVFLMLALIAGGGFMLLSPWLPGWFHFHVVTGAGSLRLLFCVGGLLIAGVLLASYMNNVNYACGNVVWPILPAFFLLQAGMFGHWLLARQHQPLWIQVLPYVGCSIVGISLVRTYVSASHPPMGQLAPLKFDRRIATALFENSFWNYIIMLGTAIYRATDALVINAHFPDGTLAPYETNYKFCDLMVMLALTASYVSLPKITQWLASSNPADQERVRVEMRRLNQFQALFGCTAALAYIGGNTLFMKIWMFHKANPILPAPLTLQLAFALNLAVTTSGDAGIQLALRSGNRNLRIAGSILGLTGLLNLGLSLVAMKMDSLVGIALATVLAQTLASLIISSFTCRHVKIPWLPWAFKSCVLPLTAIGLAGWLRITLAPLDSTSHILLLIAVYLAILATLTWSLGINLQMFKEELAIARKVLRK